MEYIQGTKGAGDLVTPVFSLKDKHKRRIFRGPKKDTPKPPAVKQEAELLLSVSEEMTTEDASETLAGLQNAV